MKALTFAIGAAGAAMLVGAAPAAAQYYPGNPYGYNQPGNVIGQVLNQVLNPYANQYSQGYGMNSQAAVQRCTAAVQQRLAMQYRAGYSPYGGYNTATNARVLGITRIEQRSQSTVRVRGVASSGRMYGYGGYGGYGNPYGGYAQAQQSPDLIFRCDVDYRGYVRDIDVDRID